MTGSYNPLLVALSYLVAALASHVALQLAARVVVATGAARRGWIAAGALAMGAGIWSMHFIGMLALELPIPVAYEIDLTVVSLLLAIAVSGFALAIASRPTLGTRTLVLASALMGAGIGAMHYTGMAAIPMAPAIRYDAAIVAASLAVAVLASAAALAIARHLHTAPAAHVPRLRAIAALVMGAAIVGMHYTGMAAAEFAPGAICTAGETALRTPRLAGTITLFVGLFLVVTAMLLAFERRLAREVDAMRTTLRNNDAFLRQLLDALPVRVAYIDATSVVRYHNRSYRELLGLAADAVDGRDLREVIGAERFARIEPEIRRALAGEATHAERESLAVSGGKIHQGIWCVPHFGADDVTVGAYTLFHDLTERRSLELALAAREREMRRINDAMPAMIALLTPELRYRYVNEPFAERYQTRAEDLVGREVREVVGERT